jgi:hypothetical protein
MRFFDPAQRSNGGLTSVQTTELIEIEELNDDVQIYRRIACDRCSLSLQ